MGQDPREAIKKIRQTLASAQKSGLPGGPRNFFGGAAGLVIIATGAIVVNNALFNGIGNLSSGVRAFVADLYQWTVGTEPLNTQG